MTFHELNTLSPDELRTVLFSCCGSTEWVNRMMGFFPMEDLVELLEDAEEQWYACSEADWREAFSNHPKIGDSEALNPKFSAGLEWAANEQRDVTMAGGEMLTALGEANKQYEEKFGYIFIVSATGKSPETILGLMQQRMQHTPGEEIRVAMDEQNKITLLRLQKLIK